MGCAVCDTWKRHLDKPTFHLGSGIVCFAGRSLARILSPSTSRKVVLGCPRNLVNG